MVVPKLGDLSEAEKRLVDCINDDKFEEVKTLITQDDVRADCLDDHGMTPLMQAAYKGNKELCALFLHHGADVNSRHHDHGYSALMFAALSGKTDVTQLMLEAGANTDHTNSVGRNASQMAAFVGQHQCVSVINNFFSKKDLQYYCVPKGLDTEPKLPPELCDPLYNLIGTHNLHPVKLSLVIAQSPSLLEDVHRLRVVRVLDLLLERMMKQKTTNEVMAMKFHYLSELLRQCDRWRQDNGGTLDGWIKRLVKGRASDNFPETQEKFLRSVIKSFPYVENQLLQQMVRTVAPVNIGEAPTALSVITSSINGQRFASDEDRPCETCGEFKAEKKCSACKMVNYCEQACQKLDWSGHKKICKKLAAQRVLDEERKKEEEKQLKEQNEKNAQKQAEESTKESEDKGSTTTESTEGTDATVTTPAEE